MASSGPDLVRAIVPAFSVGVIIPPATTLGYPGAREVTFTTPDGVRLAAWYVPGHNGAGVILMHGSHGDRTSELPYLRFLAEAGYTVLAVDARGHGESGGETNALGWHGDRDVAGAFRFLTHQSGIDPHRIAGLGLSMGAEELLRAAAGGVPLAAVVADGAGASTSTDSDITPTRRRRAALRRRHLAHLPRRPAPQRRSRTAGTHQRRDQDRRGGSADHVCRAGRAPARPTLRPSDRAHGRSLVRTRRWPYPRARDAPSALP
jgi:dienelactone hydrolase